MSEISNAYSVQPNVQQGDQAVVRASTSVPHSPSLPQEDMVEFSYVPALDFLPEPSSLRAAKLAAIKQEIAQGTYDTPWRIQQTVERLLDILA